MHKKLVLGGGAKKKIFEIKTSSKGYSIRQGSGATAKTPATVQCPSAEAAEKEAKEIVKVRIGEGYTPVEEAESHGEAKKKA